MNDVDPLTARVARYVAELDHAAVPAPVRHQARRILADTVGLMLAAVDEPAVAAAIGAFPPEGGPSTVFGQARGGRPAEAAFLNAIAAHCLELDDSHSPSLTHPASVLVPAALAVTQAVLAEGGEAGGDGLLDALVVAYDVQTRLSQAMGPLRQFDRGFHPLSVCGSVGAAVAAGRMAGLDKEGMARAIALAGSQSSGVLTFRSDRSHQQKAFHAGVAARNGVYAALLARAGFRAAPDVLAHEHNILTPYGGPGVEPELLVEGLGEQWAISQTSIKRHPSCGRSHAPLDALFALLEEHPIDPAEVERITVEVAHSVVVSIDDRPQLTHNMQHLAAVAVLTCTSGATGVTREHLTEAWAAQPEVKALRRKVEVRGADDLEAIFPERRGARVAVVAGGQTFENEIPGPLGSPSRPLEDSQLRRKFLDLVTPRYGSRAAARLWSGLLAVDEQCGLTALLSGLPTRHE
jgi:2-methylcitrate dehydratase PrpD